MLFIMIVLCQLQLDDVLRNGDVLPYQVYRGCLRIDGQTLVNLEIFSNNADGGPSGKFLHLLHFKQTTLAYDFLYFALILSYVISKSLILLDFQVHCTNFLITV